MGNQQSQNRSGRLSTPNASLPPSPDQHRQQPQLHQQKQRRNKLELPDLASLALSPTPPPTHLPPSRRSSLTTASVGQGTSAPIPIPGAKKPTDREPSERGGDRERGRTRSREDGRVRERNNPQPLPSTAEDGGATVTFTNFDQRDVRGSSASSGRQSLPAPITPINPSVSIPDPNIRATRRSSVLSHQPSFHPPLPTPSSAEILTRYESKDGELRRKAPTGAERPRSKTPFKQEVVQSTIPIGMRRVEKAREMESSGRMPARKIPVKLRWRNTAKEVYVTGSFQAVPWRQRTMLTPISTSLHDQQPQASSATSLTRSSNSGSQPSTPTQRFSASNPTTPSASSSAQSLIHEITIPLSPGTHELKFIVDDVYMCSEELQTATDNDGNLVNVLEVGLLRDGDLNDPVVSDEELSPSSPSPMRLISGMQNLEGKEIVSSSSPGVKLNRPVEALTTHINPPDQFWSSDEEYTTDSSLMEREARSLSPSQKRRLERQQHHPKKPKKTSTWTRTIPTQLAAAAQLEEEFLANPTSPAHARILKLIPPAPNLPRFLDKVILNTKEGHERSRHTYHAAASAGNTSPSVSSRGSPSGNSRRSKRHPPSPTPLPAYIATNTPVALAVAPNLGQGAINTSEQAAGAGDDKSVLPVPSHVVLNHLATSAIKGGVLAAAVTVRYRRKFITTMYYKPTSSPPTSNNGN